MNALRWWFAVAGVLLPQFLGGVRDAHACKGAPNPPPCQYWKCNTLDNVWEEYPVKDGTVCTLNGQTGECYYGTCYLLTQGALLPQFQISSVIYAPPNSSGYDCSESYTVSNSVGGSLSTTASWKNDLKVSVDVSGTYGIWGGSGSTTFEGQWSGNTTSQIDYGLTFTEGYTVHSVNTDGVDHERDKILLWLNPQVNVTMVYNKVRWSPGVRSGEGKNEIDVLVSELRPGAYIRPGVKTALDMRGITANPFYPIILRADRLANAPVDPYGERWVDPSRYVRVIWPGTGVPVGHAYTPTPPGAMKPDEFEWTLSKTNTEATTASNAEQYTVGVETSGSATFVNLVKAKLSVSDKFTWTHSNTTKVTNGQNDSFKVHVFYPSSAYVGPTYLDFYVDTVFKSYAFETSW